MQQQETGTTNPQNNTGIKWRQHEMILVTASAIIMAAAYAYNIYKTPMTGFEAPFIYNHVPFNLYKNVVGPVTYTGLLGFLIYLWVNLFTVPRLRRMSKTTTGTTIKKLLQRIPGVLVQFIVLTALLGTAYNIATYYQHQWQFNYPGFSIFFNKNVTQSQLNIAGGYFAMGALIFMYGIYVAVREGLIYWINKSKQRLYNIQVCNKVTVFLLLFTIIPVFLTSFRFYTTQFFVAYTLIVPALFATFITNVYCLFPMKGDATFFSKRIINPLVLSSFIYALPLTLFMHETGPLAFIFGWALQLLIVTPLTWWYYQSNKDSILQLRIVEKQLVRSKADLQFLRSQINPHFLFNTLNTLYGTALQENANKTAEGIQRLGDMMRFMLKENALDLIPMDKEIGYLHNYIALQKLRTQSSSEIIIEDNINEQHCNHRIAPMLLIPLVENAFKHGISLNEKSWIIIKLYCTENEITFEVRNSMHTKASSDPEKERTGIGLKNVVERLKLLYPGKHQVLVNGDGKEFMVQLLINPF